MIHSFATNTDDPTVEPRWGKVGRQRSKTRSAVSDRMKTVDDEILDLALKFATKAKAKESRFSSG